MSLIITDDCHFSFNDYSSCGVYATPKKTDEKWVLDIKCLVDNMPQSALIRYTLSDKEGGVYLQTESEKTELTLDCGSPVLWNGIENPYLYTLKCEIINGAAVLDCVSFKVGFRTIETDSEK
ncbi:MAG: hypothetical protein IKI33_06765, partial [Eubacterium sp.]|nr:hypothetical protein [Eubacterium sp.]